MNLSYDGYRLIFIIGLCLTIAFFLLAVALLFLFKIPEVIGDLSGRTARNAIKEIRGNSENGGASTSGLLNNSSKGKKKKKSTKKPVTMSNAPYSQDSSSQETSLLGDPSGAPSYQETAVLGDLPVSTSQETAVLGDLPTASSSNETAVLGDLPAATPEAKEPAKVVETVPVERPTVIPQYVQVAPKPVLPVTPVIPEPTISKKDKKAEKKAEKKSKNKNEVTEKGEANNMYNPMYGSPVAETEVTSELMDMPAPVQTPYYEQPAAASGFVGYRIFETEFDMTLAESTEVIP